jgi:hypothetical protein
LLQAASAVVSAAAARIARRRAVTVMVSLVG